MKILLIACIVLLFIRNVNAQNPAGLKSFTASQADCKALVEWTVANEITGKRYEIELSTDSLNFITIAMVAADQYDYIATERKFSESLTITQTFNYFRLKIVNIDERLTYSKVALVHNKGCGGINEAISLVSPNPVTSHNLPVTVVLSTADNLEIKITDMTGNHIVNCKRPAMQGRNDMNFNLPGNAYGQYILSVYSKISGVTSKKIFVQ